MKNNAVTNAPDRMSFHLILASGKTLNITANKKAVIRKVKMMLKNKRTISPRREIVQKAFAENVHHAVYDK